MGVTLTASLGRLLGVRTPTYDAIIHIASLVNETEYYRIGRTLANLKLAGLSATHLNEYVMTGKRPEAASAATKRRIPSKSRPTRSTGAKARATTARKSPKRKGRR